MKVVNVEWRALPVTFRELLGDCRRLCRYWRQSNAALSEVAGLMWRAVQVRVRPSLTSGTHSDWLHAEAALPDGGHCPERSQ